MNTEARIQEFIDDKEWCYQFLCQRMPAPLALRKLMALSKDKAVIYGTEFYTRFCNYRSLHKTIIHAK